MKKLYFKNLCFVLCLALLGLRWNMNNDSDCISKITDANPNIILYFFVHLTNSVHFPYAQNSAFCRIDFNIFAHWAEQLHWNIISQDTVLIASIACCLRERKKYAVSHCNKLRCSTFLGAQLAKVRWLIYTLRSRVTAVVSAASASAATMSWLAHVQKPNIMVSLAPPTFAVLIGVLS